MSEVNKDRVQRLLKGLETGDPNAVEVIHPERYIQHNPQTHEGREGLAALFARIAKTSPRVNFVRIFSDGDYVFAHTEYDFDNRKVGFEVFRFEGPYAVEHWDNIQPRRAPNVSGHSMVDGVTERGDPTRTEGSRALVRDFVQQVLIERELDLLRRFVSPDFVDHCPNGADGLDALRASLTAANDADAQADGGATHHKLHRVLADGAFVLAVCEGVQGASRMALYELFRVADDRIVERWRTIEAVAPESEWKNDNGKF